MNIEQQWRASALHENYCIDRDILSLVGILCWNDSTSVAVHSNNDSSIIVVPAPPTAAERVATLPLLCNAHSHQGEVAQHLRKSVMLKCFVCLITVSLHFCCDRVTSSKVGQDQSLADWTCNCQQGFLLALFAATDCEACAPSYTYKTICWPSLELPYSAEKTGRMVYNFKFLFENFVWKTWLPWCQVEGPSSHSFSYVGWSWKAPSW